jgi:hypothetical protein
MFVECHAARAAMMRQLGPSAKALVISGSPIMDAGQPHQRTTCDSYGWPGPLPTDPPQQTWTEALTR